MSETQTKWLTIAQLAERWNVSYDTVLRDVKRKPEPKIPSLVIGSIHRISLDWIEGQESAAKKDIGHKLAIAAGRFKKSYAGKDYFPELA